jgi:spore coat-associated protein N
VNRTDTKRSSLRRSSPTSGRFRHTLSGKLALTMGLLAVAAGVVGLGAFATFTGTASTSSVLSSGTVSLAPIGVSGANNRLSVGASGLAAGDTVARAVDVKNTGSLTIVAPTLTTNATTSSLLDTDAVNGLQMTINKCSVAWTEVGGPPYTYTCGGTTTAVLTSVPVIGANLALSNITVTSGTDNFLVVTLTLPAGSPNTEQNQSSTIQFTFTATQRAAQSQ